MTSLKLFHKSLSKLGKSFLGVAKNSLEYSQQICQLLLKTIELALTHLNVSVSRNSKKFIRIFSTNLPTFAENDLVCFSLLRHVSIAVSP